MARGPANAEQYRVGAVSGASTHGWIRLVLVLLLLAAGGVGVWRFRLSPTQADLKNYVEVERPKLRPVEDVITSRLLELSPAVHATAA